jgi:hypothetical protein
MPCGDRVHPLQIGVLKTPSPLKNLTGDPNEKIGTSQEIAGCYAGGGGRCTADVVRNWICIRWNKTGG